MLTFIKKFLISIDQLANTMLGGDEDNTLSSRSFIQAQTGKKRWVLMRKFVDTLLWFDDNHCEESFVNEYEKRLAFTKQHAELYQASKTRLNKNV